MSKTTWTRSSPIEKNMDRILSIQKKSVGQIGKKKEHIHQLWTLIFRISRRIISLHVWLWSWRATLTFPKTACRWELKCCKLILNGLWEISIIHTISWKTQRLEQQFPTATILLPNFPNEWKTLTFPKTACRWELKCCKLILNGLWEISIIHTIPWKFQRLEQQFPMGTILLPNFPIEWKGSRILSVLCKEISFAGT